MRASRCFASISAGIMALVCWAIALVQVSAGGIGSMRRGIRCWKGWRRKHERRREGCGLIRTRCRRGYCGRHEFLPVETLREFSLLISLAPPLAPSYAVALALVTHGGVVQRTIEELGE